MPKRLAILLLLLLPFLSGAQSIRLTHRHAPTSLFLESDRLYNFNLYEHSRFEAALTWVLPNESTQKKIPPTPIPQSTPLFPQNSQLNSQSDSKADTPSNAPSDSQLNSQPTFQSQSFSLLQWFLRPYLAYGTADHAFKYGFTAILRIPTPRPNPQSVSRPTFQSYSQSTDSPNTQPSDSTSLPSDAQSTSRPAVQPSLLRHALMGVSLFNDLQRAASRDLDSYRVLAPSQNIGFVSSRYVGVRGAMLELSAVPSIHFSYQVGIGVTWEDYRFDAQGLLYPALTPQQPTEVRRFAEITSRLTWRHDWTLDLHAGHISAPTPTASVAASQTSVLARGHYLRGLIQYATPYKGTGAALFTQLGYATQGAPYSRLFDLSGTANARYFFRNSLLTVAPNTFTANIFAHLCLNYTLPNPFWKRPWSAPHLFVQANALWGYLYGQDVNGSCLWEGLQLQAPNRGIAEIAAGLNGLLRLDILGAGLGLAYRLCPASASYHSLDLTHDLAVAVVADIIIDR